MPADELTAVDGMPAPRAGVDGGTEAPGAAMRPLLVSGLVVSKAALIEALRGFVPQLTDIAPLGDDRFELSIGPADRAPGGL